MKLKYGNKDILDVSSDHIKCLQYDMLSPKDQFVKGQKGRLNHSKKKLFRDWIPILRGRGLNVPSSDGDLIALILSQPDYKNMRQRAEAKYDVVDVCLISGKKAKGMCPLETTEVTVFRSTGQALVHHTQPD